MFFVFSHKLMNILASHISFLSEFSTYLSRLIFFQFEISIYSFLFQWQSPKGIFNSTLECIPTHFIFIATSPAFSHSWILRFFYSVKEEEKFEQTLLTSVLVLLLLFLFFNRSLTLKFSRRAIPGRRPENSVFLLLLFGSVFNVMPIPRVNFLW